MTTHYPKPEILRHIDANRHHLIEASAGTGKTYTLEHLVIALLLEGARLEEILVVTYTEKATHELKSRIRATLVKLIHLPSDYRADLPPESCWEIDQAARTCLERALFDFENAAIHTIHGFCHLVLREFAFENGQLFEMEQVNQRLIFDQMFYHFLRRHVLTGDHPARRPLLAYLAENPRGLQAERSGGARGTNLSAALRDLLPKEGTLAPDLQAAGAALNRCRDFMREHDVTPHFERLNRHSTPLKNTLKLLEQMREVLLAPEKEDGFVLAWFAEKAEKFSKYMNTPGEWKFLKEKPDKYNNAASLPETMRAFIDLTETICEHACSLEAQILLRLLPEVQRAVTKEKQDRGWFDFDDMIQHVAQGLTQPPRREPLRRALRRKFRYALIDEFQDTDESQWTIFSTLFLNSQDHRLFLIGDPKQAIYRFRGADVHTYLRARKDLQTRGGRILRLDRNYRASPQLVAGIHAVFSHDSLFSGDINYDAEVRCGRPENQLAHDTEPGITCLSLIPGDGDTALTAPKIKQAFSEWIGDCIRELLAGPMRIPGSNSERPLLPKDIAVLTRSRREAELLGRVLTGMDIPNAFYKQAGLFQTKQAQDFFDLLDAIDHPRDEAVCFKALLTDFFPLELADLLECATLPETYLEWFAEWHYMAYRKRDYRRLFDDIFKRTCIFERLLFTRDDERAVTNYEQIVDLLKKEGRTHDFKNLIRLLGAYIDGKYGVEEDLLRLESEREAVQIMTIHASKGLEFPVVFLFGGFSGKPGNSHYHEFHDPQRGRTLDFAKVHEGEHKAEIKGEFERLYYVALTRARYKLFLPILPEAKRKKSTKIGYAVLEDSLRLLCTERNPHFSFRERVFEPKSQLDSSHAETAVEVPAEWQPSIPEPAPTFQNILRRRTRFGLTSYTQMMRYGQPERGLMAESWLKVRRHDEPPAPETSFQPSLPKGKRTGICLHEILERTGDLNLATYAADAFYLWKEDPAAREIIQNRLKRHDLEPHYNDFAELVWNALRTPVLEGVNLGDLPAADRLHEVDFHYPLDLGDTSKQVILNGSIDLAFRNRKRYYFADWKSDALTDYQPQSLAKKIDADYSVQIQIYLWAMLRWLKIADAESYESLFGGLFYLFPRGMDGHDSVCDGVHRGGVHRGGVYFLRPTWQEARQYEEALRQSV